MAFESVSEELKDIYAITDLIVARSGANSILEFLALNKAMLLVPLEAGSRREISCKTHVRLLSLVLQCLHENQNSIIFMRR